jgi:hypothetical protein
MLSVNSNLMVCPVASIPKYCLIMASAFSSQPCSAVDRRLDAGVTGADDLGAAGRKDVFAVELAADADAVDFAFELSHLALQGLAVLVAVGKVDGLHRQFAHALQHVADLADGAFCRLQHGDAVVGIARGLLHAAHLAEHALGNGQAAASLALLTRSPLDRRCMVVDSPAWLWLRLRCAFRDAGWWKCSGHTLAFNGGNPRALQRRKTTTFRNAAACGCRLVRFSISRL